MLIILPRDGVNIGNYLVKFNKKNHFILVSKFEEVDISSTKIRELVKNKEYNQVNEMIDSRVLEYIIDNRLHM